MSIILSEKEDIQLFTLNITKLPNIQNGFRLGLEVK